MQHALSRAEWTALAYFVQQGAEAFNERSANIISRESQIGILQAFLAVYALRTTATSSWDEYFLGNLPSDFKPERDLGHTPEQIAEAVRTTTVAFVRELKGKPRSKWAAILAARNLYVMLEEEPLAGADELNSALHPFWPILWRVAARGHFFVKGKPLREEPRSFDSVYQPAIPSINEEEFQLSFAWGQGNDFALLLSLPGVRGPMYPISPYPEIAEFRAMLAHMTTRRRGLSRGTGGIFWPTSWSAGRTRSIGFAPMTTASPSASVRRSGRRYSGFLSGVGRSRRYAGRGSSCGWSMASCEERGA